MKQLLLPCLAALVVSACSSVSVRDLNHSTGKVSKPQHIYVAPFDTQSGLFQIPGKKTPAEIAAQKSAAATLLADYTVKNVTRHVAPASKVEPGAVPRSGWLVTGRFTRVSLGSRGLRAIVGLGAGGTKMETSVEVFDLSKGRSRPFLTFSTTGGSNAMPGLLESSGPGSVVFQTLSQAATGVTDDAARTSRMIAGSLSEYFGERGWVAKDKVFKVKKPGEYQLIHGM